MSVFNTPPLTAAISFNIAAANADFTMIGAPGAGLRLRIIYILCRLARAAAAGAWDGDVQDGVGGTVIWRPVLQQPNWWSIDVHMPTPGIQLSINTALNLNMGGTIAGPTAVRTQMWYYVDSSS